MSNIVVFDQETESKDIENKINYLQEFLAKKENLQNPHKYIILEYFPMGKENYKSDIYEIHNLVIDTIEHGVAYFDDAEGILEEKMYANEDLFLKTVVVDSIIYMQFHEMENKITISFDNGYIQIYY